MRNKLLNIDKLFDKIRHISKVLYMSIPKILYSVLAVLLLTSCDQAPQKRRYDEIVVKSGRQPASMMSDDDPHRFLRNDPAFAEMFNSQTALTEGLAEAADGISWTTPDDWVQKPGGGFRLVSFAAADPASAIDVSIVKLEGPAGGINANIVRWMGQLDLPTMKDKALEEFLGTQKKVETANGLAVGLVDFTLLQKGSPATAPSMIAAIIEQPQYKLFIKLTGTISAVEQHREAFTSLCRSIKIAP